MLRRQEAEHAPTQEDLERMAWATAALKKHHESLAVRLERYASSSKLSARDRDLAEFYIGGGLLRGSPSRPGLTPEGSRFIALHGPVRARTTHHSKTR
jgi:hypothetical protein